MDGGQITTRGYVGLFERHGNVFLRHDQIRPTVQGGINTLFLGVSRKRVKIFRSR
jgi:hypothetical protein